MNGDRRALWLLACGWLLVPPAGQSQIAARLHLPDQPVVSGELLEFHPPTNVTFRAVNGDLHTNGFRTLMFAPPASTNAVPTPSNRLQLTDGSRISGTVRSMDQHTLTIEPAYAPPLTIPRTTVTSLRRTDLAQGVTYEGPYRTNDWIISPLPGTNTPSWIYRDGMFLARGHGTLARETGMSTIARVEFDLYWSHKPRFRVNFFARETHQLSFSEGYVFYSPGHGTIFAMTRSADPRQKVDIRRADIPALVSSNYVHLDFRLNSQRGEGWLFADGRMIRHWTDLGISGAGQAVVFQNFDQETRLAIANLRVSEWDGRTSVDPPPTGKLTTIVFKNGDTVRTRRAEITGTNLTFTFNNAPLTVPAARVAKILSPPAPPSRAGLPTWIQFVHGDWIRAEILQVKDDELHWRRTGAPHPVTSPMNQIRGIHIGREKPVLDLSWYFPKIRASVRTE